MESHREPFSIRVPCGQGLQVYILFGAGEGKDQQRPRKTS